MGGIIVFQNSVHIEFDFANRPECVVMAVVQRVARRMRLGDEPGAVEIAFVGGQPGSVGARIWCADVVEFRPSSCCGLTNWKRTGDSEIAAEVFHRHRMSIQP